MISVLLPPVVATASLYITLYLFGIPPLPQYSVLATLAFVICLAVYREVAAVSATFARKPRDFLQRSAAAWAIVVSCLAVLGFALQYAEVFSRRVLLSWAVVTPLLIAAIQFWAYTFFVHNAVRARSVVIAGVSDLSRRLAQAIATRPDLGQALEGWFEDRSADRIGPTEGRPLLGGLSALPAYVKSNSIDVIYIALPIRHEERTKRLVDELHDTTASIYFVPDIFVFDLIQSRVDVIDGLPILALCETPFFGINGLVKRVTDLVLASLMLLLAAPVMLFVAIGVGLTTPGSVIFKQRRYGLDGREIVVYKFRSMRSSDDGANVPRPSATIAALRRSAASSAAIRSTSCRS